MPYGLRVRVPSSAVTQLTNTLGNRLMVGHRTLTPFVQVRILVPQELMRSRETVSRRAHNPKIGGSIPSSAKK